MPLGFYNDGHWGGSLPQATNTDFEGALAAALLATTAVVAVVGTQVNPVNVPESYLSPSLTFAVKSSTTDQTLDGPSGVVRARVELVARSRVYADCKALMTALRNAFDGFSGNMQGVPVIECALKNRPDDYVMPDDGSDLGTHELPCDLLFRYREPLPVR